jgi:hypothetical protein
MLTEWIFSRRDGAITLKRKMITDRYKRNPNYRGTNHPIIDWDSVLAYIWGRE